MSKQSKSTSRRNFLKMTTVGAPAVAAVSLTSERALAAEPKVKDGLKKDQYYYKYLELARF